jgi:hypothetical protein
VDRAGGRLPLRGTVGHDLGAAAAASRAGLTPEAAGTSRGKIFTGGDAPILVSKGFVFSGQRLRKPAHSLAKLSTGAFSTLRGQSEPAFAALSTPEPDPKKLVRNPG